MAEEEVAELVVGGSKWLTMPHPEKIFGIAVKGDTLFGGQIVTRHFFTTGDSWSLFFLLQHFVRNHSLTFWEEYGRKADSKIN